MVPLATKMVWHVNYIIVDQNTKYCEDWTKIDETARSCFNQKYVQYNNNLT